MPMTDNEFLNDISKFYNEDQRAEREERFGKGASIIHAALGIAGEAGEVVDLVKKSYAYGRPLDAMKVCEELGDLLHYMTRLADQLGLGMNVIREQNVAKLKKRFGDTYSDEKAIARKDKDV